MSSNNDVLTIVPRNNQRNTRNNDINGENNINSVDNIVEVENTNENVNERNSNNREMKIDNFAENNISIRNIIDNALFSQLSEIKVKLLDFDEKISQRLYKSESKILPKIDLVEFTSLSQKINISGLKKYGFGLYVFFLYLINLLITFGILFIFAFHYMYCIFYKYYRDYEEEYSIFFDYNILSLVSGVQIIRFRKYYIDLYGKEEFLKNYKDFDVIYKEYLFTGTIIFIVAFLINFSFVLYLQKTYKLHRIDNPEIKDYTLILSGKDASFTNNEGIENDENNRINDKKTAIKNQILKELNVRDADINFTLKLSEYYEKMEEFTNLQTYKYMTQYKIGREKCCCHGCCCFCSKCFCCCRNSLLKREKNIQDKIENLKKEMNEIKSKEIYNPLYIITFEKKEDYNNVYSNYSHSYLKNIIKNIIKCKRDKTSLYINKAPNPEDIVWKNLEFDKEYKYFINKLKNFGISLIYVVISFIIQIFGELIDSISNNLKFLFFVNIIVSYLLELLDSFFSDKINSLLINNSNSWSYSDIKFYSILFQSIFKFINKGLFPLLTYYCFANEHNDYSDLVSKMFIIIEMDGFGYPMIDWLYSVVLTKGKDMYESTQKMMTLENIEKEISEKVVNKEGLSRLELEQSYEKKEMDIEGNYSDILSIYWITMFYSSIYPIGIIQSFLNLFFKFIIEKSFLLNAYKRPKYINPQFGFLCFNSFNIGFFLFLCGDIIFFKNEDNKKSFGAGYIVIMLLILIIPFYLLSKLIMYLTHYCCLKKKESDNLNDIKQKMKSDYRTFNPCYQKEKISQMFYEYHRKNLLTNSQYKELIEKLNRLNDLDLYRLQQNMRTPKLMTFEERKITSGFIYQNDSLPIKNEEKEKLYYLLMQLGFISYLEEGNVLKPKKKRIEFMPNANISSISLRSLSMQENLSNCDSGYFTTFEDKKIGLTMAYVDNERNVKIFDVFHKQMLNDVKDLKHSKKIVCVDYYLINEIRYLISIALDNTMIISDLSLNEKDTSKIIKNIGDTFVSNQYEPNNTFSLSTVRHQEDIWIITSYYYDKCFKIFNVNGDLLHRVKNDDYIISLEGLFYTEENTYICVRSPNSINLFINEFFIKQMKNLKEDAYINFKILKPNNLIIESKYIIITIIKKDLSTYTLQIIDIFPIFPLFTRIFNFLVKFTFGQSINSEVHTPMNEEIQAKISKNSPLDLCSFPVKLQASNEQIKAMQKFLESDDNEKFNIGNALFWENVYVIVGTPFNYLDIINFELRQKVGVINNTESIRSLNYPDEKVINDIISYNISGKIDDPEYGESFIMRDNKGKIQYIRPAIIGDKLNYKFDKSKKHFNDLEDDDKLTHILFSTRFYFIYLLVSYLIPLITAICGHISHNDSLNNTLYTASFSIYVIYAFFGIWFKGCVYDIKEESHTQRTCTKIMIFVCLGLKICANSIFAFRYCQGNKTGIIFVSMLFGIYFIHLNLNFIIYACKIKFLLRTYWLGFLFYQLSRFCILIFFIFSIIFNVNHVETYIYAGILCIILIYMFMANYFNTLMKDIMYNSYIQAIFNYPMEWMNLFCFWHKNPKECIKEIDIRCCCCDSYFLALLQLIGIITLIAIVLAIYYFCYLLLFICQAVFGGSGRESDRS